MKQKIIIKTKSMLNLCQFCVLTTFKASKKYFFINIVFLIAETIFPFLTIRMSKIITDSFVSAISRPEEKYIYIKIFIFTSLTISLITIASKVINNIKNYTENMQRDRISQYLNNEIIGKAASLDLKYFDTVEFYNEITDTSNNKYILSHIMIHLFSMIKYIIQAIIALIYVININWKFAFFLIIAAIPAMIWNNKLYLEAYSFQRERMGFERKIYYLFNICTDRRFAKEIKFYNLGDDIKKKHNALWNKLFLEKSKFIFRYYAIESIFIALPEFVILGILIFIGYAIINGQYTVGDYTLHFGLIYQLMGALNMIILYQGQLSDGKVKSEHLTSFINWENEMKNKDGIILDSKKKFTIEFRDVSFSYKSDSKNVLNHINFIFSSDQKIALVGINGSGKSTLIKLLLRFYDPTEGMILVNGIDLKEYNLYSVRKCFGILFQDYCSYAFTVAENVALEEMNNKIDSKKLERALKQSGAWDFVSKFEDGVNTCLTVQYEDSGKELSGGQWQKIALARTFFRDAPMIILDEPSSSLDPEAECNLFKKISELYKNKGAILISHRLANITSVDCIINIENGKIIEMGSHKELMKSNKRYAYLYNLQADQYCGK